MIYKKRLPKCPYCKSVIEEKMNSKHSLLFGEYSCKAIKIQCSHCKKELIMSCETIINYKTKKIKELKINE